MPREGGGGEGAPADAPAAGAPARHAWRDFADLSVGELHAALRLRCAVFVVEQASAYPDVDGRDPEARHLLAWGEGELVGTLRLFPPDADGAARIGRVAVARGARGAGLGRWMMREALVELARRHGPARVVIGAQARLERYYEGFGFARASDDYDEDGVLHLDMVRPGG